MAVLIQYVVERNGVNRMTFSSKQQADAYDKMLDLAEQMEVLLTQSQLLEQQQIEDLALFLAQQKDDLVLLVQGKTKSVKKEKVEKKATDTAAAIALVTNSAEFAADHKQSAKTNSDTDKTQAA